jgi:signal transduction histidine kinase
MSSGWGSRWGQGRRDRLAYLAMLRRSSTYQLRATAVRCVAVAAVGAGLVNSDRWLSALLLWLPAAVCVVLQLVQAHQERVDSLPRRWPATALHADLSRKNGRHDIAVETYAEIAAGLLLVVLAAWVVTDLPPLLRLVMLAAAVGHFTSTACVIFTDHAWFNPDERGRPAWHEMLRWVSGPLTAGLVSVLALPADWPESTWLAAVVVCLTPLLVSLRVRDADLALAHLTPLIAEEAHAGRELVISETHGALSTHLRLLEQQARDVRSTSPTLYELAVSANARLRETMTLARIGEVSSTTPASLAASVLTLARAVGAEVSVDIDAEHLGRDDRELARIVLSDLVGNAVNAGAGVIAVHLAHRPGLLVIEVEDDAPPMPVGVWKSPGTSSARLESRLAGLQGSLMCEERAGTKTVRARWAPRGAAAERRQGDDHDDDVDGAGAAG